MKKTIFSPLRPLLALLIMAAACLMTGCTHNNGDIGRWFGTWTVERILVDGEPYAPYEHNMVWKFQNSVFSMQLINTDPAIHERLQHWGSWSEADGALIIDFTHSNDAYAPGEGIYAPFPVSLLNRGGTSVLRIASDKGNEVTLLFTPTEGEEVTYIIRKQ